MIDVPRETRLRLDVLRDLVLAENGRQNLISAATVAEIEARHIADSVQLLDHLPPGELVDIGTGAGFPGLVLACCRIHPIHLVEPRRRRAGFLERTVDTLQIADHVTIWPCKVERLKLGPVAAITARAVGSLDALFAAGTTIADTRTKWILPKGRSAKTELDTARRTWQGDFTLVPSVTDPEASIVIASNVHRRR